jgi:hypothetical protein
MGGNGTLKKWLWIAVVTTLLTALADDAGAKYGGFAEEIFFGRHTAAAGAAAGRVGVVSSGDIINTFYNPAGLGDAAGVGFCLSWVEEARVLTEGDYRFLGGNVRIADYGVLGVSRYNFDYSPVGYADGSGGKGRTVGTDASITVVTLAGEPRKDLLLGLNISSLQYDYEMDRGRAEDGSDAYWIDVGGIKYWELARTQTTGHWLRLGGSISNLTGSSIDISQGVEDLPVALRLGSAYEMAWWGLTWRQRLRTVETVVQAEYQDILNYGERAALRLGGEVRFVEVLVLRLGYYRESVDDAGGEYIEDTTYGFGVHLPLHKITDGKLPLKLGVDYANMAPAEYQGRGDPERLTTVTFCAGYYF